MVPPWNVIGKAVETIAKVAPAIVAAAKPFISRSEPDNDEEQRREHEKQLEHELEEQRREHEKQLKHELEEQRREHEKLEEQRREHEKLEEQRREHEKQLEHELEEQRREHEKQLEHEQRKRKKQVIAIGVVCLILSLVIGSVTWYGLQPSQPSEQIVALEELEKYEKARDAGLQALEDYVINNPNSPYISQAKDQIRAYQR